MITALTMGFTWPSALWKAGGTSSALKLSWRARARFGRREVGKMQRIMISLPSGVHLALAALRFDIETIPETAAAMTAHSDIVRQIAELERRLDALEEERTQLARA
ncbi:MAG: hypothetical protein WBX25_07045 [Rhodomicrobium sp.]